MNEFFTGILDNTSAATITTGDFLLCLVTALLIGGFLALVCSFRNRTTASFLLTIGILPAIVCVVIMLVNGNIGAGVAVAGAFSLVRFRSVPGRAREIAAIFLAMGTGLVCGMGYLGYALLFALILGAIFFLFNLVMAVHGETPVKVLRITVPEDLDFDGEFDEVLTRYTDSWSLVSVKTAGMGALYRLQYELEMKDPGQEKEMIDLLRTKNGNLEIALSRKEADLNEM